MNPKFVVSHLDQQLGPFDEQELKAKWAKGELLPIDYVYDEAKKDWILLAERFTWAAGVEAAPPPLKPDQGKKKMPPVAPNQIQMPHSPIQHPANIPVGTQVAAAKAAPAPIQTRDVLPVISKTPAPAPIAISSETLVTEWRKAGAQGAKVKIVDGMGEVDLSALTPGQLELILADSSASSLKLQEPLRIQVLAVEPEEIQWNIPPHQVVGQDLEIQFRAVDGKGSACSHYADDFLLHVSGGAEPRDITVRMAAGVASVKVANTKAETWNLKCDYHGKRQLRLPQSVAIEWQPGPAARLILDGPPELVAGNPLKVQVKAVDQYGNLAKTFQGTVILEVKAS